jgi:hypothetical protein
MQMIRKLYRPFGVTNSRVMIGGGVLGLMMLGEAAFAYGSSLV